MPHGPNHRTAESSSEIEGGSAAAGTCDMTGDYDILVIRDSNNSVTHDCLHQVSQPVTSNIVTPDVTHDCDLWDGEHHITSLSGHFGYLENNAKVLASSVLRIARFIQKYPIGSRSIEQVLLCGTCSKLCLQRDGIVLRSHLSLILLHLWRQ